MYIQLWFIHINRHIDNKNTQNTNKSAVSLLVFMSKCN